MIAFAVSAAAGFLIGVAASYYTLMFAKRMGWVVYFVPSRLKGRD